MVNIKYEFVVCFDGCYPLCMSHCVDCGVLVEWLECSVCDAKVAGLLHGHAIHVMSCTVRIEFFYYLSALSIPVSYTHLTLPTIYSV